MQPLCSRHTRALLHVRVDHHVPQLYLLDLKNVDRFWMSLEIMGSTGSSQQLLSQETDMEFQIRDFTGIIDEFNWKHVSKFQELD